MPRKRVWLICSTRSHLQRSDCSKCESRELLNFVRVQTWPGFTLDDDCGITTNLDTSHSTRRFTIYINNVTVFFKTHSLSRLSILPDRSLGFWYQLSATLTNPLG